MVSPLAEKFGLPIDESYGVATEKDLASAAAFATASIHTPKATSVCGRLSFQVRGAGG